jgi:hypothetical protein
VNVAKLWNLSCIHFISKEREGEREKGGEIEGRERETEREIDRERKILSLG